jgi:predicted MFS family arabinose efflux permease
MSGLYAGLALGGLGGYISESWGWRSAFLVFGIFGILYAIFLYFTLKERKGHVSDTDGTQREGMSMVRSIGALFKERSFNILLFYFTVLGTANWLIYGWLPTFLKEQFNLRLGEAGISATGYIQLGSLLGVVIGGLVADRWARRNPKSRIHVIIMGFTVGAPFLFLMSTTSVFALAIFAMVVFGLARGFNDANLMPILRQVSDERYIATGYGFLNLFSSVVGGLMVYVGGALKDADLRLSVIYQSAAVLMLIATWSLFFINKVKRT